MLDVCCAVKISGKKELPNELRRGNAALALAIHKDFPKFMGFGLRVMHKAATHDKTCGMHNSSIIELRCTDWLHRSAP